MNTKNEDHDVMAKKDRPDEDLVSTKRKIGLLVTILRVVVLSGLFGGYWDCLLHVIPVLVRIHRARLSYFHQEVQLGLSCAVSSA